MRTTVSNIPWFQSPPKNFLDVGLYNDWICKRERYVDFYDVESFFCSSGTAPWKFKWYWCAHGISKARISHAWTIIERTMHHTYSVTQSYANSFLRDVVNISKDEDNILDQIYIKQICLDFYYEDFKFWEWLKKMQFLRNTALYKKKLLIKLGFRDNSMLVCIFV